MQLNKIHNMNCIDGMKEFIPNESIDMILTSPPYDHLRFYGNKDKKELHNSWNFEVFKEIAKECSRVLKPGGIIVWVVGDATINGSESGTSFKQALFFKEECGLNLYDTMIYQKQNFIPLTHKRYEQCFEYMFIFSKGKPNTFNPILLENKNPGKKINRKSAKTKEQSVRGRDEITITKPFKTKNNIWTYNIGSNFIKTKHPAVFPFQLAIDHILSWTNENDIVLDPFMGGGTTIFSSILYNRNYIGFEIEKKYYNETYENLLKVTNMVEVKKELYSSRKSYLNDIKDTTKNLWILSPFNSKTNSKKLFYFIESNNEIEIKKVKNTFPNIISIYKNSNDKWLINNEKLLTNEELKNFILNLTNIEFKSDRKKGSNLSTNFSTFFREEMGQGFNLTNIDYFYFDKNIMIEEKTFSIENEKYGLVYYGQAKIYDLLLKDNKNLDFYLICSNNGKDFKYANIKDYSEFFEDDKKVKYKKYLLKDIDHNLFQNLNILHLENKKDFNKNSNLSFELSR